MNRNATFALTGLIGLLLGAGIIYIPFRPHPLDDTCNAIQPSTGSVVYGVDVSDGTQLFMAVIHFVPGGYRHNVATLEQQPNTNGSNQPHLYNMGPCAGSPPSMTMTDESGNQLSQWTFGPGPGSGSTSYSVTVTPQAGNIPPTTMTGNAYPMQIATPMSQR